MSLTSCRLPRELPLGAVQLIEGPLLRSFLPCRLMVMATMVGELLDASQAVPSVVPL